MIIFKKLSWKNFLSTGNYKTTLDLIRHGTTLVSGENGAGKSTMLDALTYSLFGKSFRGINIPQLVNSINDKDCVVEIEFSIGKDDYRIIRGQKPKIFEIYKNKKMVDQDSKAKDYQKTLEENILKMSYKAFCQIVILGSSNYIPFMRLSASDRRAIVENLLDIDIFSSMNTVLKSKVSEVKEKIKDLDYQVDLMKNKIEAQEKFIRTVESKSDKTIEKYNTEIKESRQMIGDLDNEIDKLRSNITELMQQTTEKSSLTNSLQKIRNLNSQIVNKVKGLEDDISFYENNDTCPTCTQPIDENFKSSIVSSKSEKKKECESGLEEIKEQSNNLEKTIQGIDEVLSSIRKLEDDIKDKKSSQRSARSYMEKMQDEIELAQTERQSINEERSKLKDLALSGKDLVVERMESVSEKQYYDYASILLKDGGIKSKIIKHYLPIMNKLINKYLVSMDFFCQFNLDESFDETIKSRHRDEFTYQSFSEGERLRIDLSLLLAWREISRLRNSTNCNLLILDEVFDSSLDAVGTEEFLKLLNTFGNKSNIFVISHKSDSMTDKFQNHIVLEKKNNFSKIK